MVVESEARMRKEGIEGWVEDESEEGEEDDGAEERDGSGEGADSHRCRSLEVLRLLLPDESTDSCARLCLYCQALRSPKRNSSEACCSVSIISSSQPSKEGRRERGREIRLSLCFVSELSSSLRVPHLQQSSQDLFGEL